MNLVVITALVAVAGAAKLDHAYLPPASAKTAGGSPGSLQTPFAENSFNNGLGGLPKGSYNNDFQGVVVDAAAAGTRASEPGDSGLGASRISYGSTDSKVGAAAFKDNTGFPQPNFQNRFAGTAPDGQTSGTEISQGFQSQGSQQFSKTERARAALDRAATIIRFESEVGPENFNYAFETDNGISAEESGVATNGVQAQGAYSYTGDDGQVYSVTYTADERGYLPQGDHLPTPPPIPAEILKSLEQNAREEAAGLIDDGSYDAQKYNAGSDYAENDDQNGKYNHQSSKFGNRNDEDATASGTFISQSNQPFARPGQSASNPLPGFGSSANKLGQSGIFGTTGQSSNDVAGHGAANGQFGSSSNVAAGNSGTVAGKFGSTANRFGQTDQEASTDLSGNFGQTSSSGFGSGSFGTTGQSSKDVAGHGAANGQFGSSSNIAAGHFGTDAGQFGSNRFGQTDQEASTDLSGNFGQTSSGGLAGPFDHSSNRPSDFGQSTLNRFSEKIGQDSFDSAQKQPNKFSPSSQLSQGNIFGNKNGYLPPMHGSDQNRPQTAGPHRFAGSNNNKAQQFDQESDDENENVQPLSQQKLQDDTRPQGSLSFRRPSSNRLSVQNSNNDVSNLNQPSNNALRPSSNGDNSFAQTGSSSSQTFVNRFGSKNEYLPPVNSFNQNGRPNQGRNQGLNPPNTAPSSKFNQQSTHSSSNIQSFDSFQSSGASDSAEVSTSQPSLGTQSTQKFNSFQGPQSTTNAKPSFQLGNRFSSTQGVGDTSGFSFASQHATTQPDTELTTPFETSGPQNNAADTFSSSTLSSFTSSAPLPSNRRPMQPQFGTKITKEDNASPIPTSPSIFPSFNTESTSGPKRPGSQRFGQSQSSTFPTQASQGQVDQESRFGNKQPSQNSLSQTDDAQFSPSTSRPSYSQQQQGLDDSYYYNQPSRPFGTPQGSRFPDASSNKFNRVTQAPSFPSQSNQFPNTPESISPTAFPTQTAQFQGSTKYPRPPTIAPTSSSQQINAISGITQASVSPFPSEAPTQSAQFNQQGQFGSKPNYQQSSNQFNQGQIQFGKPSFGQQSTSSQPSFGQLQTTATPSFPQRFGSSNKPSFQGQSQTFGQQSLNQNQPDPSEDTSESTPSQQYDGEVYEYKKPPQSLPAPDHQENTSGDGQFGQKEQTQLGSKPQFGQIDSDDSQGSTTFQFGQTVQSSRPQFGASSSRPQFGQNAQAQSNFGAQTSNFKKQSPLTSRFGSHTTKPVGSSETNRFEQSTDSQEPQPTQESRPQFGAQNAGRPFSSCCQFKQAKPTQGSQFGAQAGRPSQDFGAQTQNRFSGQTSSFSSTQGFNPDPTTSSFAGKGEVFGGPRKPPSFDPETGYHY